MNWSLSFEPLLGWAWPGNPWTRAYQRRQESADATERDAGWLSGACLLLRHAGYSYAEIAATPPPFLPNASLFENFRLALEQAPIGKAILNSVLVSGAITVGTVPHTLVRPRAAHSSASSAIGDEGVIG